jgi:hypothetical protein
LFFELVFSSFKSWTVLNLALTSFEKAFVPLNYPTNRFVFVLALVLVSVGLPSSLALFIPLSFPLQPNSPACYATDTIGSGP